MVLDRPLPSGRLQRRSSLCLLINGLDEWLQPQALSTVVSDYRGYLLGYLLAEREHPSPPFLPRYDRLVFIESVRMINCMFDYNSL